MYKYNKKKPLLKTKNQFDNNVFYNTKDVEEIPQEEFEEIVVDIKEEFNKVSNVETTVVKKQGNVSEIPIFHNHTTKGLVFYFRDSLCYYKKINKFYSTSYVNKEVTQINKAMLDKGVTVQDVALMIDFLFKENVVEADIKYFVPHIVVETWFDRLYENSRLWRQGKYIPKSKQVNTNGLVSNSTRDYIVAREYPKNKIEEGCARLW